MSTVSDLLAALRDADNAVTSRLAKDAATIADLLEALRTTAGNIRSLIAAGAVPKTYEAWLAVVDAAIAKAEGRAK